MATAPTVGDIPGLNTQIDNLNQQEAPIRQRLSSSPTAGGSYAPSAGDVSSQQELDKIQNSIKALTDQKLKAQWYPPATSPTQDISGEGATGAGVLGDTLNYLGRPLRGIVGAVQHFSGQGHGDLLTDVADNMTKGNEYFGDVLAKAGAPGWVSAPLGFALDIGLDPVNWATMGEAALLPKIAGGFVRGGLEGGTLAAKAGVLEKATTAGRFVPGFGTFFGKSTLGDTKLYDTIAKKTGEVLGKEYLPRTGSSAFQKLADTTAAASADYREATGLTADKLFGERGMGAGSYRVPLSTLVEKVAEAVPGGYGTKALSTLVYDPIDWVKQSIDRDIILRAFHSQGVVDMEGAVKARAAGEDIAPYLAPIAEASTNYPRGPVTNIATHGIGIDGELEGVHDIHTQKEIDDMLSALPSSITEKLALNANKISKGVDDVASINKDAEVGVNGDALTNGLRVLNETGFGGGELTMQDIADVVNSGALGDTGVQWFDNMMKGVNDFGAKVDENGKRIGGIGEKTLNYYDKFMALFRGAKVGGSPVGHMNAIFGNAIMNHLGIGDIGPDYWQRYYQVYKMYENTPGSAAKLHSLFMDAQAGQWGQEVLSDLSKMETATKGTFGDVSHFLDADYVSKSLARNLISEAGNATGFDVTELSSGAMKSYTETAMKDIDEKLRSTLPAELTSGVDAGTSIVRKAGARVGEAVKETKTGKRMQSALRARELQKMDVPTDMMSQELFDKPAAREMFDYIAERAKEDPGNLFWKAADTVYNKMSNQYSKWDQVSKMTTFIRSTRDGYTLPQLIKARHLIDINPGDYHEVVIDGITRYRLNARKGIELANALYMNYAAMPSAIRVLRNMPIVGSPFASFMYGMALKTGQALAYNPAAFNKVNFAMNEFGGTPTPLEKQALNTKFYSYLKQPGMYRVPFTDANPIYLNLANMIPYYSMNMFTPSQQSYDTSKFSAAFSQAVDQSPFLKDPFGQILFNNLIQPAILSEGIQPQGQFGQALWPSDADFLTKLGYSARDFSEAIIPGVGSFAGLAGGFAAPGATNYVPLYRYRNLANAVQGKNVYGITGKEPAASRTLRGVLSAVGVPVQAPVNLTFNNNSSNN